MANTVCRWALVLCFVLAGSKPAISQVVTDPLAAFKGRWTWTGHRDKLGLARACAEKWEEFQPSADRRELKNRFLTGDGPGYILLYQEGSSVTMYLRDEGRRLKHTRDRLIWVATFTTPNRFHWRVYSHRQSARTDKRTERIRCPSP